MSQIVGFLMIIIGTILFISLFAKLIFQPFIPEKLYIHSYFPSTELVLGIPILCGTIFLAGFGLYILRIILKNNLQFL